MVSPFICGSNVVGETGVLGYTSGTLPFTPLPCASTFLIGCATPVADGGVDTRAWNINGAVGVLDRAIKGCGIAPVGVGIECTVDGLEAIEATDTGDSGCACTWP